LYKQAQSKPLLVFLEEKIFTCQRQISYIHEWNGWTGRLEFYKWYKRDCKWKFLKRCEKLQTLLWLKLRVNFFLTLGKERYSFLQIWMFCTQWPGSGTIKTEYITDIGLQLVSCLRKIKMSCPTYLLNSFIRQCFVLEGWALVELTNWIHWRYRDSIFMLWCSELRHHVVTWQDNQLFQRKWRWRQCGPSKYWYWYPTTLIHSVMV